MKFWVGRNWNLCLQFKFSCRLERLEDALDIYEGFSLKTTDKCGRHMCAVKQQGLVRRPLGLLED